MLAIDEVHLIHRTQSGDPEAFSPLVIKYQPRLYRHIHRRVTDAELAEDLTQEVWLKAFDGIKTSAVSLRFTRGCIVSLKMSVWITSASKSTNTPLNPYTPLTRAASETHTRVRADTSSVPNSENI